MIMSMNGSWLKEPRAYQYRDLFFKSMQGKLLNN